MHGATSAAILAVWGPRGQPVPPAAGAPAGRFLPGASGIDLQRHLAEDGHSHPVIFITAHDVSRPRREAEALGAVAFLPKPFEGKRLVEAVGEALRRGRRVERPDPGR